MFPQFHTFASGDAIEMEPLTPQLLDVLLWSPSVLRGDVSVRRRRQKLRPKVPKLKGIKTNTRTSTSPSVVPRRCRLPSATRLTLYRPLLAVGVVVHDGDGGANNYPHVAATVTTVSHTYLSGGAGARSALMPRSSTDRPRLETIRAEEVLEDDARPTHRTHIVVVESFF